MSDKRPIPDDLIAPAPPSATIDGMRRRLLTAAGLSPLAALALSACGGGGGDSGTPVTSPSPTPSPAPATTAKRGIAYDLKDSVDFAALDGPVAWWCNWALDPATSVTATPTIAKSMTHVPMLWNGNFNDADVIAKLKARPAVRHLLVLNEPNLVDQANLTPAQAAALWPRYEAVATQTGVQIVGPAITWGTMTGYADPVVWLDAFYAAYRNANGGRDPRIDALAFHWYDYGLGDQLDRLAKYGKPFWITEMANWHSQADGAQIDTVAKQQSQMTEMVRVCEARADVVRYAWFTGRWSNDVHFTSLFNAGAGALSEVGKTYIGLPKA